MADTATSTEPAPAFYVHAAADDSDGESTAELEDLPLLKPVPVDNAFLNDGDRIASARVVQDDYETLDYRHLSGPPELVRRLDQLASSMPRHWDPMREGIESAAAILSNSRPCKLMRRPSETVVNIALQFWLDIRNDSRTSREASAPGTATQLYLYGVARLLKRLEQSMNDFIVSSLVERSRSRGEMIASVGQSLRQVREHLREARKRLGLAQKIHTIAFGPGPLRLLPIMSMSYPRTNMLACARMSWHQFNHDGNSLYPSFPDVATLQAIFIFLRGISLDINNRNVRADSTQDDGNGDQPRDDPQSEATTIRRVMKKIRYDCRRDRLAFANAAEVEAWKVTVAKRIGSWCRRALSGRDIFKEGPIFMLQLVCIALCCAGYLYEAADTAECLVIAHRDVYEAQKNSATKIINLSSALGVLALCKAVTGNYFEAVLAVEDARDILRPLHSVISNRTTMTMSLLRVVYSRFLQHLRKDASNPAIALYLTYKAHDAACWALPELRELVKKPAANCVEEAKSVLAWALRARAVATKVIRRKSVMLQHQHRRTAITVTAANKPSCCVDLTVEESHYLHARIDAHKTGKADSASAEQAIKIYRALACAQPLHYEHMLAEALHWKAVCHTDCWRRAMRLLHEAAQLYSRLSHRYRPHFVGEQACTQLALFVRCLKTNQLVEAEAAIAEAIRLQGLLPDDDLGPTWRGFNMTPALAIRHARLLLQLEQYEDALQEATRAEQEVRLLAHDEDHFNDFLGEALLVQGVARLLLYQGADKALESLEAAVLLLAPSDDDEDEDEEGILQQEETEGGPVYHPADTAYEETGAYVLATLWKGAATALSGRIQAGTKATIEAFGIASPLIRATYARRLTLRCRHVVDPLESLAGHILTVTAALALDVMPPQVTLRTVEDALKMMMVKTMNGRAVDAPTMKTALLIKMHVLLALDQPLEAARVEAEAELIPARGFLDQLRLDIIVEGGPGLGGHE